MCLLDGGTHYHREAHRILQKNIPKGWPFIRELKYEVVMLPRWLVSTPIRTYGVGGLTNNANTNGFAFPMTAEMGQPVHRRSTNPH